MARPLLAFLVAVFAVIVAAKFAYTMSSDTGEQPINKAWQRNTMSFVAWNNGKWTARIHDGQFDLIPQNKTDWHRHSNPSVAFTDWDGESWQAKIDGNEFLLAHEGDWQGSIERSAAIRYRDWTGNNQLRTVTELQQ